MDDGLTRMDETGDGFSPACGEQQGLLPAGFGDGELAFRESGGSCAGLLRGGRTSLCSGDADSRHGGLVSAEGVAFGEESHHILLAVGTSVQLVGHIGQTCRHAAQQHFDVQRVFLDHRARAVRVSQGHAGHVPPAAGSQRGGDVAVRVGDQFVDQRGRHHMRHVGDHRRGLVMRFVVHDDDAVADVLGDHRGDVEEAAVVRGLVHGDGP